MSDDEHVENMRLLRLIREDPGWALSRVKRAAELEALHDPMRGLVEERYKRRHILIELSIPVMPEDEDIALARVRGFVEEMKGRGVLVTK